MGKRPPHNQGQLIESTPFGTYAGYSTASGVPILTRKTWIKARFDDPEQVTGERWESAIVYFDEEGEATTGLPALDEVMKAGKALEA